MVATKIQITRDDLDHFFKRDWSYFDCYGQYERQEIVDQIYDGLLKGINDLPTYTRVIKNE